MTDRTNEQTVRTYLGWNIARSPVEAWWVGTNIVAGFLVTYRADTLAGLRQMIRDAESER